VESSDIINHVLTRLSFAPRRVHPTYQASRPAEQPNLDRDLNFNLSESLVLIERPHYQRSVSLQLSNLIRPHHHRAATPQSAASLQSCHLPKSSDLITIKRPQDKLALWIAPKFEHLLAQSAAMESLPTEIDEHIIRLLPQAALNSMSRVSKGYHALTEPYLYRNIVFSVKQELDIFRLFFTILKRNDLAKYIHSVSLTDYEIDLTTQEFHESFFDKLLDTTAEVKDLIKKVTASQKDSGFTIQWFGSIYHGFCNSTSGAALNALALIACSATNLESLRCWVPMPIMLDVALQRSWRDPKKDVDSPYPFHKLKDLNVAGKTTLTILPSLEHVYVGGPDYTKVQGLYFPYLPNDKSYRLQRLVLMDVNMSPTMLGSIIDDFGCPALEELCVRQACWYDYDFAILSGALVSYTPNLRTLEWTEYDSYRPSDHVQPFGSLSGFQNLTTLALDYTLMTSASGGYDTNPIHLLDPQGYLPVSLKSLTIASFPQMGVYSLCSRYMQHHSTAAVMDFMVGILARTSLSTIKVWINIDDSWTPTGQDYMRELPRRMRKFLPQLVTRLHEMDVDLAVWRSPAVDDDKGKLLYKPGYEAPWPHLDDYHQDHWTWETRKLWEIKTGQKPRPNGLSETLLAEELSDDEEEQM
jgi:hypothetical protein